MRHDDRYVTLCHDIVTQKIVCCRRENTADTCHGYTSMIYSFRLGLLSSQLIPWKWNPWHILTIEHPIPTNEPEVEAVSKWMFDTIEEAEVDINRYFPTCFSRPI